MDLAINRLLFLVCLSILKMGYCKYMEGRIKTSEKWIFLARFCFLSGDGQFEYSIEYNENQGHPNLLLYYDTEDQWPAVYKMPKSCYEKESVLSIQQNQIINLTLKRSEFSGCVLATSGTSIAPIQSTTTTTESIRFDRINVNANLSVDSEQLANVTEIPNGFGFYGLDSGEFQNITEIDLSSVFDEEFNVTESELPTVKNLVKRSVPTEARKNEKYPRDRNVICRNARRFRSSRERWWFVAISNCKGRKGIDIKYKILMTNGPPGDYWHEQFSADEFYILPVLMGFTIAYTMLILAVIICSVELKSRQLLHSTYKLFTFSVVVQYFGILMESVTYLQYAMNGIGAPKLKVFGQMVMGTSEICFLLLLLLLAKGYTVTRGRLSLSTSVKLTVFTCLYTITYASLFIYEAKVFDPGEVLYLYESPAGYGIILLRTFAWCFFIYSTVCTLKKYPEKCNFYYPFNICGTLWFIAGPAFILSANSYIDKWIRESIVCAVLLFISFGGHLMFLLLTMPSVANKNFPYHVRTTQIGVMELTGNSNGIEHFNHHVYEPSSFVNQPNQPTVIVPLTRRTEEMFGGVYAQQLYSTGGFRRRPETEENEVNRRDTEEEDATLRNVLDWSLARAVVDDGRTLATSPVNRNNNNERNNGNEGNVETRDGVESEREVPLELFTIGKKS